MTDLCTRRLAVFALLAVLAFALSGCWNPFAPPDGDKVEVPPADYHERLTPEDVLHNLETAYVWRNVDEYLNCLSEDFEFHPDDDDVGGDIPPKWYKTDESDMHNNMFDDDSDVESISLTLTTTSLVYDYGIPEDPLDDTCVCQVSVDLRVNLVVGVTLQATADSQFDMRIDIDQWGPNDELLWEIFLWFDLGDDKRGASARDPEVTEVSLAELKSMFME